MTIFFSNILYQNIKRKVTFELNIQSVLRVFFICPYVRIGVPIFMSRLKPNSIFGFFNETFKRIFLDFGIHVTYYIVLNFTYKMNRKRGKLYEELRITSIERNQSLLKNKFY